MYSDNKMVLQLMSLLKQFGIRRIVISPGSRHFALVHSLEADPFFKLYSVVDERSAAFFALGLMQKTDEIVAVTCSSGTACMNYGSAVVEAYYQRLPLLVLSSDRIPQLLNQLEDQFYDQLDTFTKCTKYQGQLPVVKDALDEWYCNRIINEALLELTHHGNGPVHLNIPFVAHDTDTFGTSSLPLVRKISLFDASIDSTKWGEMACMLKGKKIMIVWGQSVVQTSALVKSVNSFVENFDAIILTDFISNCHCSHSIQNTTVTLASLRLEEKENFKPDIVITVGGNYIFNNELKNYLRPSHVQHWQVGKEDRVCDPFYHLVNIFEMPEELFFSCLNESADFENEGEYAKNWLAIAALPEMPTPDYNELYAVGALLKSLPKNVDLQLANSCTIRMAHFFHIDPSVTVHCNRGVNGIDGSMSTAVGFSAENERMTFYITGDLSFFYDMNSLWIRHLSSRMRIMLINNGGGAVMYGPLNDKIRKTLPEHIAAGHYTQARGWVESLGFKYLSAHNKQEIDEAVVELCGTENDGPVFLEVFTDTIIDDINSIREYLASIDRKTYVEKFLSKVKGKVHKIVG